MIRLFSRSAESIGYDILANQVKIMGDLTTLNANITALSVALNAHTSLVTSVTALVGTLKVAPDQAAIDAAAANVATAATQIAKNSAALTAVLPVTATSTVATVPSS